MEGLTTESIYARRAELRSAALQRRDALTLLEREMLSYEIIENLKLHLQTLGASFLHCYISFRSEVETRKFIEEVVERGLRIVVPVVEELDGVQFLLHTEIQGLKELRDGAFGLQEPVERSAVNLEGLDVVILPLSTFDRRGNRLGYGKGFYDRFLSQLPRSVQRIGLAFSIQESDSVPVREHDEVLDVVITERETITCNRDR